MTTLLQIETSALVMLAVSDDRQAYASADGHAIQREQGLTPNGNAINGRWVLRSPSGGWIDHDQYRHDLAERHCIKLMGLPLLPEPVEAEAAGMRSLAAMDRRG